MAKGNIIAAVAVLLIHIERKAVMEKRYITATNKFPRAIAMILLAIILSSFCICKAVAKAKPPKNKKMVGSANATKACLVVTKSSAIASNGTNRAVTVTCNASVNQRIATKANNAKPAFSLGAKGKDFNKIKKQAIASRKIIPLL